MAELRNATTNDIDAVLDLWVRAEAEPTTTDDAPSIAQLLAHDPGALIVATDAGAIVGTAIVGWDGWRGTMYRVAVAPECRRTGLASALVAEAERRLRARGARRLHLIVALGKADAEAFWQSCGYVSTGQPRYVKTLDT